MDKIKNQLAGVAALLGVIAAIGGGFVQYGKIQAKLTELDKRKPVINQTVDLGPVNDKIASLEVDLIDRIETVDGKIVTVDLVPIKEDITELKNRKVNLKPINDVLEKLKNKVAELKQEVAIVSKENELQDVMIEEIKTKANNPLAN